MADQEVSLIVRAYDFASAVFDNVRQRASSSMSGAASDVRASFGTISEGANEVGGVVSHVLGPDLSAGVTNVFSTIERAGKAAWESIGQGAEGVERAAKAAIGGLGGLTPVLGGVLGVAGAAGIAIGGITAAIVEMGERGSHISQVEDGFRHFAGGVAEADAILQQMRTGVLGTISDFALEQNALHLLSTGVKLTADDFGTLTRASVVLHQQGFGTTTEVLEKLSTALVTGRTRAIDMMTGVLDAKQGEDEYADSIGAAGEKLTKLGQTEEKREAILQRLRDVVASAGAVHLSFADQVDRAQAAASNFWESLEVAIANSPAITTAIDTIADGISHAFGDNQAQMVETLTGYVSSFAIGVTYAADAGIMAAQGINSAWSLISTVILGVELTLVGLVSTLYNVAQAGVEVAGAMHIVSAEQLAAVRDMGIYLHGMTVSLAEQTGEAAKGVVQQNAFGRTLSASSDAIAQMRARMIQASSTAVDHTQIVNDLGAAHDRTGKLTKDHAGHVSAFQKALEDLDAVGENWHATLDGIDGETAEAVRYYLQAGVAIGTLATAYGLTEAQARAFTKEQKAAGDALKETAALATTTERLWDDYYKTIAKDAHDTLASQQAAATQWYDAEEAKLEALEAKDVDVTQARIALNSDYYAKLQKARDDDQAKQTKYAQDTSSLWQQVDQVIAQDAGQTRQQQMAGVERWFNDEVAKLHADDAEWSDHYAALEALATAKMAAIAHAGDPVWAAMKDINRDTRQEWANTWEQVLSHTKSWKDAMLQPFNDLKSELKKIAAGILADWEDQLFSPLKTAAHNLMGQLLGGLTGGGGGGGFSLAGLFGGGGSGGGIPGSVGGGIFGGQGPGGLLGGLFGGGGGGTPTYGPTLAQLGANPGDFGAGGGVSGLLHGGLGTVGKFAGAAGGTVAGLTLMFNGDTGAKGALESIGGGAMTGASIGSVVPGIGTAIGAGVGAAIGGIKALLSIGGPSKEEVQGRDLVGQFQQQTTAGLNDTQRGEAQGAVSSGAFKDVSSAGELIAVRDAYLAIGKSSQQAQQDVNALWAAEKKGPEATQAAMQPLLAALQQQKDLINGTDATLQKYGITWDQLGASVKQAHVDQELKSLQDDSKALQKDGLDQTTIIEKMAGAYSQYVQDVVKSGTTIPASMQPVLQQLADQGKLVDANGNKITDLSKLTFAASAQEALAQKNATASIDGAWQTLNTEVSGVLKLTGGNADASAKFMNDTFTQQINGLKGKFGSMGGVFDQVLATTKFSSTDTAEQMKQKFDDALAKIKAAADAAGVDFTTMFTTVKSGSGDAAGAVTTSLGGSLNSVKGQLGELPRIAGDAFGQIRARAAEATDEVNHLNFGHSPGGLKEIPLLLASGEQASSSFLRRFVDSMRQAQGASDAVFKKDPAAVSIGDVGNASQVRTPAELAEYARSHGIVNPNVFTGGISRLPEAPASAPSKQISIGDIHMHLPPGTDVNDPQKLAESMAHILRTDTGFVRTGIESIADERIKQAVW